MPWCHCIKMVVRGGGTFLIWIRSFPWRRVFLLGLHRRRRHSSANILWSSRHFRSVFWCIHSAVVSWCSQTKCRIDFSFLSLSFSSFPAKIKGFWLPSVIVIFEYLTPKHRSNIGNWPPIFFTLGLIVLSAMAYFIRDWRWFHASLMVPTLVAVPFMWYVWMTALQHSFSI